MLPLRVQVDWHEDVEIQALKYCEQQSLREVGLCVPFVEKLIQQRRMERYHALVQGLHEALQRAVPNYFVATEGGTYSFTEKVEVMKKLVQAPSVKTVCEIG